MKPITSPTSPKKKADDASDLQALYNNDLRSINKPHQKPYSISIWSLFLVVILSVIGGALGAILWQTYGLDIPFLDRLVNSDSSVQVNISQLRKSSNHSIAASDLAKLVNNISPSIVSIYSLSVQNPSEISADLLSGNLAGNGFILTDDGFIVTTQKTIAGIKNISVVTSDSKIYEAKLALNDPASELSILKITATGLTTLNMSDLAALEVGQNVVAISQRLPQAPLVATLAIASKSAAIYKAISSAISSSEKSTDKLILSEQLASLFNNSIAYSDTGDAVGIITADNGAAEIIPFSVINPLLDPLLRSKKIIRPFLGVNYLDISKVMGLPATFSQGQTKGALIYFDNEKDKPSIVVNSPAQKAGLMKNDIITAVDDQLIDANHSLAQVILGHQPGETITVKYFRDSVEKSLKLKLEELSE